MGCGDKAFVSIPRHTPPKRPVELRIRDWNEVEADFSDPELARQAARCMDCGVAFCHKGCPLGNHIPEWNEATRQGDWKRAAHYLHVANNFPEFTGRICPAPCEEACVLNINDDPVTIRQIEKQAAERAWQENWVLPRPAAAATGKRVAVIGSGPAGLAAAQQLARAGHQVAVLERDDRLGGLLRYGIPDFKLEKWTIDRRLEQMRHEGVAFHTGVDVGGDVSVDELLARHHAVVLAIGAQQRRELDVPGVELDGVHYALDYLIDQNKVLAGDDRPLRVSAAGKRVVILGGGDTGADCLGTAHRQGALEVRHFHYKPAPPGERTAEMPWPWWPMVLRESSSHEEGGERAWSVVTTRFEGGASGAVARMHCARVEWVDQGDARRVMRAVPGTELAIETDLVLIAIGYAGAELEALGHPQLARRGGATIGVDDAYRTAREGVFACGDSTRGASLVVWAIWEGREAARAVDTYLMGRSDLPTSPNRHPM